MAPLLHRAAITNRNSQDLIYWRLSIIRAQIHNSYRNSFVLQNIYKSNFVPGATWRVTVNNSPTVCNLYLCCYVKIRRHPQNRKYIGYRTVVRLGPSHIIWANCYCKHFDNKVLIFLRGEWHPIHYCGQTAGWMKMPLGTEVDLRAGRIVSDGFPALRERRTASLSFRPMSTVAAVAHLSYCWALVEICQRKDMADRVGHSDTEIAIFHTASGG